MIRTLLFDLDETLYPPTAGVMARIGELIQRYLVERLGLTDDEAAALRRQYVQHYGTTLRGLQIERQVDAEAYLRYVHDLPLETCLRPNPELERALGSIRQRKVVFTNASREHAERVLALLGVGQHFCRIVDVRDVGWESKPQPLAYELACRLLEAAPHECLIVEDSLRNLRPARALGMTTVLVKDGDAVPGDGADYVIPRIEEIGKLMVEMGGG